MNHPKRLEIDQVFYHFWDSIFDRFWVVLGRQVGVIFGTFGGQVGPSWVLNAFRKLIFVKNVKTHETLRLPMSQGFAPPQDGLQNAPRSTQDGSKRLLKSNCFALEDRCKSGLVLGAILNRFWLRFGRPTNVVV